MLDKEPRQSEYMRAVNKKRIRFFIYLKIEIRRVFYAILDFFRFTIYPFLLKGVGHSARILQNRYESIQDKPEHEWAQPVSGSFIRTIKLRTRVLFYSVSLLIGVFIIWATFFEIDEYVSAVGEVDPESDIKIVNHMEGGILKEILVKEGDSVKKGQSLIKLDNALSEPVYEQNLKEYFYCMAHLMRLHAQIYRKPFIIPQETGNRFPEIAKDVIDTFNSKTNLYIQEGRMLKDQLDQNIIAVKELAGRIKNLSEIQEVAQNRANRYKILVDKGLVSRSIYDQIVIEMERNRTELDSAKTNYQKALSAVKEAEQKLSSYSTRYDAQNWESYEDYRKRLNEAKKMMELYADRIQRNEIRSPSDGIVHQINIKTLGSSLAAGRDIISIVPVRDSLRINGLVRPQDIGFVKIGQKVSVKVSAFDYSIYGALEGVVEAISPDTIKPDAFHPTGMPQQQPYYRVYIRVPKDYILHNGFKHRISSGMTVQADIVSGKRSVMFYILKPIVKATSESMHEK